MENWNNTENRFVAFFDILGFKDLVENNTHLNVLDKLYSLKKTLSHIEDPTNNKGLAEKEMDKDQTKVITFSDSIIVFSKSDKYNDALKVIYDAYNIVRDSVEKGIPIKGSIAYGQITVDFNKSLFFGKPIIDAYLLHEELQMITAIFHHSFEVKIQEYIDELIGCVFSDYKANLKSGRVTHAVMHPYDGAAIVKHIEELTKIYKFVSGRSRLYIDNTIEFLKSKVQETTK
jgi:hypothetical protein